MMRNAAAEFEGNMAASTAGQLLVALRDQITPACQQTIANRYPFIRSAKQEVPLGDFAKLFSPGGLLDKFFTQHLAPYANTSRSEWVWRPESPVGRTLSQETLRQFQKAAYIRDAFFQSGGNVPMVTLSIKPPVGNVGITIKTDIGGTVITSPSAQAPSFMGGTSPPPTATPTTVQWPGPAPRTAISVASNNDPPSVLERTGPWSLFRMLEAGSLQSRAETSSSTFIVAGNELNYQISTGSIQNPFNLTPLREFRCPSGI
jgi:type VI secretion system protein ImpL